MWPPKTSIDRDERNSCAEPIANSTLGVALSRPGYQCYPTSETVRIWSTYNCSVHHEVVQLSFRSDEETQSQQVPVFSDSCTDRGGLLQKEVAGALRGLERIQVM